MKTYLIFALSTILSATAVGQPDAGKIPILIRCDDIGMSQSVNAAAKKVLETGIPVSMSVMVPCGWFAEAVEMLKQYPNVSVGIHLTLNAEWKQYRWGPVAGATIVPSLVDSLGHFSPRAVNYLATIPALPKLKPNYALRLTRPKRPD